MKSGTSRHSAGHDPSVQTPDQRRNPTEADSSEATESGARYELVDASRYDLDRLERAVRGLVAQQQILERENERFRAEVTERDALISRLASELDSSENRRRFAIARVEALIDEMDRLDAALDRSMTDSLGPIGDLDIPRVTPGVTG